MHFSGTKKGPKNTAFQEVEVEHRAAHIFSISMWSISYESLDLQLTFAQLIPVGLQWSFGRLLLSL